MKNSAVIDDNGCVCGVDYRRALRIRRKEVDKKMNDGITNSMSFPNTMNEFLEQYSFKDTDEVYTNGSELIQVLRVKQGLEHYDKEIRTKAIEEFAEKMKELFKHIKVADSVIDMVVKELKGEQP